MRLFAIAVLAVALPVGCAAQRGGSGGFHGGGLHAGSPAGRAPLGRFPSAGSSVGRGAHGSRFNRYSPYGSLLFPFWGDDYDLDDLDGNGYPVASPPPMIPFDPAAAGSRRGMNGSERAPAPAAPVMIVLKDGRYVRVSADASDGDLVTVPLDSQSQKLVHDSSTASGPAAPLPPAVLVFRDGHSEEVRSYTIANGILYAHGDLYTDGYWSKQIALASLNLPETLQANASRNVPFAVPSSPNEVIARF